MDKRSKVFAVSKTLLICYFITILLLLGLAFLLYKFKLQEQQIGLGVNLIYILACFIGGILLGKSYKRRRLFLGLLLGVCYFGILLLISFAAGKGLYHDWSNTVKVLCFCVGSGAVGAIVG